MRCYSLNLSEFEAKFKEATEKNGIEPLSAQITENFYKFAEHLLAVNQITNLTAIRDIDGIIFKHFVDSLLVSSYIPKGVRVLDLGCGPGFPSLPLAIARADLEIVGLDSTAKKIAFVNETAAMLSLKNLHAVVGRAEDDATMKKLGAFDVVTSRAVANPVVLCELSLPYLKIGGIMLAMKGAMLEEETKSLNESKIIGIMGGKAATCQSWKLITDAGEEARGMIELVKERKHDPKFPRAYATILKKPL